MITTMKNFARWLLHRHVYTVQHGLAKGLKRRGGFAFLRKKLSSEEQFLLTLNFTNQTVYDVGGWEGIFTCFFARAVGPQGQVVTFEPNPRCQAHIRENVRLNHFENVQVIGVGLSSVAGKDTLVFSAQSLGVGSLQADIKRQLLDGEGAIKVDVELDTLDHQIALHKLPPPAFIKIDVEGLEYDVLAGMSKTIATYAPKLYIEIHGADDQKKIENVQKVVSLLYTSGYTIKHIESGEMVTLAGAERAKAGHLYCLKA